MSFIAAAIIGGVGAIAGGAIAASGAESAASTQAQAAENAQQISQNEFNTITQQEQPYVQSGYGAQSQLNYLLGIGPPTQYTGAYGPLSSYATPGYSPSTGYGGGTGAGTGYGYPGSLPYGGGGAFGLPGTAPSGYSGAAGNVYAAPTGAATAGAPSGTPAAGGSTAGGYGSLLAPFTADTFQQYSPAYQFQLQQGGQGVLNADAAGQGALSGSAMKDLISFNQNLANTSFNNAFNQYQTQQGNIYQRLAGVSQLGQAAAANTGQQGTALAGQAAQSATNVGTALAGGTVGAANAISGGVSNLGTLLATYGGGGNYGNGYVTSGSPGTFSGTVNSGDPDMSAYSDRRLKRDIVKIGALPSGLAIYRFRYIFGGGLQVGVMADEAEVLFPDAVHELNGFKTVDYGKIH